ncbi:hypothetical protein BG004_008398 [Podila humilis]|nr:hypothetical protein BG004_008398 [Podila humilis]
MANSRTSLVLDLNPEYLNFKSSASPPNSTSTALADFARETVSVAHHVQGHSQPLVSHHQPECQQDTPMEQESMLTDEQRALNQFQEHQRQQQLYIQQLQLMQKLQSMPGSTTRPWYPTFGPAITTSCSDSTIQLDNPHQYTLMNNARLNKPSVGPHWRSIQPSAAYSPTPSPPSSSPTFCSLSARMLNSVDGAVSHNGHYPSPGSINQVRANAFRQQQFHSEQYNRQHRKQQQHHLNGPSTQGLGHYTQNHPDPFLNSNSLSISSNNNSNSNHHSEQSNTNDSSLAGACSKRKAHWHDDDEEAGPAEEQEHQDQHSQLPNLVSANRAVTLIGSQSHHRYLQVDKTSNGDSGTSGGDRFNSSHQIPTQLQHRHHLLVPQHYHHQRSTVEFKSATLTPTVMFQQERNPRAEREQESGDFEMTPVVPAYEKSSMDDDDNSDDDDSRMVTSTNSGSHHMSVDASVANGVVGHEGMSPSSLSANGTNNINNRRTKQKMDIVALSHLGIVSEVDARRAQSGERVLDIFQECFYNAAARLGPTL